MYVADLQGKRLPYMFLVILFMSFILLMLVFRSLLVPLKAVGLFPARTPVRHSNPS